MPNPAAQAFANPLFRGYVSAGVISAIGDQLTLIALPWLALSLTSDLSIVASVLALVALPRAIFLLVGGAMADRFNPKRLLMMTRAASAIVLAALCLVLGSGGISVPALQAFALVLGTLSAVGMPAASAMVPRLLPKEQVSAGNSVVMSIGQLVALVGPLAAGAVLATAASDSGPSGAAASFMWAFGIDACTFLMSALLLGRLAINTAKADSGRSGLKEAWRHLGSDRLTKSVLFYLLAVNVFVAGPVSVAMPVLVKQTLEGSAIRYGTFLTLLGVGGMVGMLLSAKMPPRGNRVLGRFALLDLFVGAMLAAFSYLSSAWLMSIVLVIVGMIGGYIQASSVTLVQGRTPPALMGRMMSFLLFAYVGLIPLSAAVAGHAAQSVGMTQVLQFAGLGAALSAVMVALWSSRAAPSPAASSLPAMSSGTPLATEAPTALADADVRGS